MSERELLDERSALLRAQIDATTAELVAIGEQIAKDGYSVKGSEGQDVPNRLIRVRLDVQRGQRDAYRELQIVAREIEADDLLEKMNAITRRSV